MIIFVIFTSIIRNYIEILTVSFVDFSDTRSSGLLLQWLLLKLDFVRERLFVLGVVTLTTFR